MRPVFLVFATVSLLIGGASAAHAQDDAHASTTDPMAVFAPLAGKTWRGEGVGPNGKPLVDIARYEWILGGKALQSTHKLEGGSYGGRTIFFYDAAAGGYIFHYFTTAGFHTTGAMEPSSDGFSVIEIVNGHEKFAEVRSEMVVDNNELRVVTRHVTHDGEVSEGDTLVYKEIDGDGVTLFENGVAHDK